MPIQRYASENKRTSMNTYDISRWTSNANNQALYKSLADASNMDMRGADNIKFDPHLLVGGAAVTQAQTDPSFQRYEYIQAKPIYLYAGGFLIFLLAMKYLTSSK
jgi:hypothetical protein